MRILFPTVLFVGFFVEALLSPSPALADDIAWKLQRGTTSAGLAETVVGMQNNPRAEAKHWGLLSSSSVTLPNTGEVAVITFWRLYHHSTLGVDGIYRCVDVFSSDMQQLHREACYTPVLNGR